MTCEVADKDDGGFSLPDPVKDALGSVGIGEEQLSGLVDKASHFIGGTQQPATPPASVHSRPLTQFSVLLRSTSSLI